MNEAQIAEARSGLESRASTTSQMADSTCVADAVDPSIQPFQRAPEQKIVTDRVEIIRLQNENNELRKLCKYLQDSVGRLSPIQEQVVQNHLSSKT
jgi:hypothetical protein